MQSASRVFVVFLVLSATWAVAAPVEAATSVRECVGTNPAPLMTRCTLAVGSGHQGIVGAGFKHAPCVKAATVTAVPQPCYVGTMVVDVTWAKGSWRKVCTQIVHPTGTVEDNCTKSGVLPGPYTPFALICESKHYTQDPKMTTFPGGVGPFGCWVSISV